MRCCIPGCTLSQLCFHAAHMNISDPEKIACSTRVRNSAQNPTQQNLPVQFSTLLLADPQYISRDQQNNRSSLRTFRAIVIPRNRECRPGSSSDRCNFQNSEAEHVHQLRSDRVKRRDTKSCRGLLL